tara:strand:- start:110 stop:637 length:528 start_codon:yes stop_codon:yes gene_type:complete
MILNIFELPIFVTDIECEKIVFKKQKQYDLAFLSEVNSTKSTIDKENILFEDSEKYLINLAGELLKEKYTNFKLSLLEIWSNKYIKKDYQEPHIHPKSHFSFIIYKKVDSSKTYFISPNNYLIESFGMQDLFPMTKSFHLKNNQMIIFPSFLAHGVKNSSNEETIAGNLLFQKLS